MIVYQNPPIFISNFCYKTQQQTGKDFKRFNGFSKLQTHQTCGKYHLMIPSPIGQFIRIYQNSQLDNGWADFSVALCSSQKKFRKASHSKSFGWGEQVAQILVLGNGILLVLFMLILGAKNLIYTQPETNIDTQSVGHPTGKVVFQPSIFRCYVSFREGILIDF